jgi:TonB family protein
VEVHLDKQGEVLEVNVVKPLPFLNEAALEAARHFKFKPAVCDGKAIEFVYNVTFNVRPK